MSYAATATPHLRAVRTLPNHPLPNHPLDAEHRRVAPMTRPAPAIAPESLLAGLQDGAAVVAALPQSVLPQGLLTQLGAHANAPLVGYLVLVPAEKVAPAPVPAPAPAPVRSFTRPAETGISVDLDRRNAYVDGALLDLTYLEFELLAHLTEHPHRVHTRDQLVHTVWGYGHVGDGRTVDVHVARLRRKLGAAYRDTIVTVRRVGYKYAPVA
ncbi:winged helix-turn-helix domain-containing protein [Kitasatospora sp. NPDC092948]|uniref:winged helix-turn-helix domain-containing protein n=1 Tax=Kitasatospora sp. NPDC092948 TaxID=3364088 RepID=UPI003805335D